MIRFNDILEEVLSYNKEADVNLLKKAYIFSAKVHKGQLRLSGEPYLNHPLEVAWIIAKMKMDTESVAAGLLHDTLEDTYTTLDEIEKYFGSDIAFLVDGVTKIGRVNFKNRDEQQAENFRKMIVAMAKDIRVIIIKLADRLHNMRTLMYHSPEKRREIAKETLDIYAPFAHRLGIGWMRMELEDLSFRYLEPDIYYDIVRKIAKSKKEREAYIKEVSEIIAKKLSEYGIKGRVEGRAKHIYSIYQKMLKQQIDYTQVYDLIAFRIIVGTKKECYETLGLIHSLWKPVPGRFKDYIALPKANMYQSLHTTVIGPYGERVEIQIRTEKMHQIAEYGIASHWLYKEGEGSNKEDQINFSWLRRILEWQQHLKNPKEFMRSMKIDLYPDEVYVFTPKGEVKELPKGATPVDFAYAIHSEIGDHCLGAKVNGKMVPLDYRLRNGDVVEIVTGPSKGPNPDWLKFVVTPKARTKIRQKVKNELRERAISLGKEIIEKQLRKEGTSFILNAAKILEVAKVHGINSYEDLFVKVGTGKISAKSIIKRALHGQEIKNEIIEKLPLARREISTEGVLVKGVGDILIRMAKCCNPLPGDPIVGYITKGGGVVIHTADCPNVQKMDPARIIEVIWDSRSDSNYTVKVKVVCEDRKGLLASISSVIAGYGSNIKGATVETTKSGTAICIFEMEVANIKQLSNIFKGIENIKGVLEVCRLKPKIKKAV